VKAIAPNLTANNKSHQRNPENIVDLNVYDLIFIGTGIHYSTPNEDLMVYLKNAKWTSSSRLLSSSLGVEREKTNKLYLATQNLLQSKNQNVLEKSFLCYGGWNLLRRGHRKLMNLELQEIGKENS